MLTNAFIISKLANNKKNGLNEKHMDNVSLCFNKFQKKNCSYTHIPTLVFPVKCNVSKIYHYHTVTMVTSNSFANNFVRTFSTIRNP